MNGNPEVKMATRNIIQIDEEKCNGCGNPQSAIKISKPSVPGDFEATEDSFCGNSLYNDGTARQNSQSACENTAIRRTTPLIFISEKLFCRHTYDLSGRYHQAGNSLTRFYQHPA